MAFYSYKAISADGKTITGSMEAATEQAVSDSLEEAGMSIVYVTYESQDNSVRLETKLPLFGGSIKKKDIVIFSRQLAVMVGANLTLVQALRIVQEQVENNKFKAIITDIANEVESGSRFSQATSKYPNAFSQFFSAMISSGETSGKLDEVLQYLADQEEKDYDLQSKIRGALIYPAFIVGGLFLVGTAMMIFVVPQLTGMLIASGAQLPLATKILIAISSFMRNYWWSIPLALFAIYYGYKKYAATEIGRRKIDDSLIKLPIFGPLLQKIYIVRFTRSLSTLLNGGVTLPEALKIVAQVVGNKSYQDLLLATIKEVEDGSSLSVLFSKSTVMPSLVSQMIVVGERTGRLEAILQTLSDFYTREITNTVNNLTSLLEPVIMLIIGLVVGGMVVAIIMPMYKLADQF
jgi:type IV pilus assembly protein PilC